jgi:hypothetical protein
MTTDYVAGANAVFSHLWQHEKPSSVLDIGCGNGAWLRAALDLGVNDVLGVDGLDHPQIRLAQLSASLDLGRRFDLALCLEVGEHLDARHAEDLITIIAAHTDKALFSAAVPGQPGEHHVNCQWPAYWQERFNRHGFVCEDCVRWQVWNDERIEPWYRQNLFLAYRDSRSGKEPRIPPVVHAALVALISDELTRDKNRRSIEDGHESLSWYVRAVPNALACKLMRWLWSASQ